MKSFFYTLILIFLPVIALVSKTPPIYAAAPGTFDCGASGGGMACAVVFPHACDPGTKPDETVCQSIGRNIGECNITKDVACIPDTGSNTADCVWNRTFCIARNPSCQQGYTNPCDGLPQNECNRARVECKIAKSNTTECIWYPPSRSCQPANINCRSGYVPNCGVRTESDCNTTDVSCVSYDAGPSTPLPSYDPTCTAGSSYYGYKGVKTALGCLPTDPQYFINLVTPWAIGIGSGIAFLLGLYGSLMIVISAGDPEKMQAGKEIITSAVAGLLLIVFAVFILRIIGVDVLKLF